MNRVNKLFIGKVGKENLKELKATLQAMPNTVSPPARLLIGKFKCMAKGFTEVTDTYDNTQIEFIGQFYLLPINNNSTLSDTIRSTRCVFGKGVNDMVIDDMNDNSDGVINPIEFEMLCYMHPSTKSGTGYAYEYKYQLNEKHETMDNPFSAEYKELAETSAKFNTRYLIDEKIDDKKVAK
jgi:hypothetical protein